MNKKIIVILVVIALVGVGAIFGISKLLVNETQQSFSNQRKQVTILKAKKVMQNLDIGIEGDLIKTSKSSEEYTKLKDTNYINSAKNHFEYIAGMDKLYEEPLATNSDLIDPESKDEKTFQVAYEDGKIVIYSSDGLVKLCEQE